MISNIEPTLIYWARSLNVGSTKILTKQFLLCVIMFYFIYLVSFCVTFTLRCGKPNLINQCFFLFVFVIFQAITQSTFFSYVSYCRKNAHCFQKQNAFNTPFTSGNMSAPIKCSSSFIRKEGFCGY